MPQRAFRQGADMNLLPNHRQATWEELFWWSPLLILGFIIILPFYLLAGAEYKWRKWHGLKDYYKGDDPCQL